MLLRALAALALLGGLAGAFRLRSRAPAPVVILPDAPSVGEQALLRVLAAASPTDPGPARRLGDFYRSQSRPFEALWAYSFALQSRPTDPLSLRGAPAAALGTAQALQAALLPDAAIARMREVLAREPGQGEAVGRLAELDLRTGQPAAALVVVLKAGPAFRGSRTGALLEGRAREAMGDAGGAKQAYERALSLGGPEAAVWDRLGRLALSQGDVSEARQAFERSHSLDPAEPRYTVDLGRCCAAQGGSHGEQEALDLFAEVVRSRPDAPAFYEAGRVLARQHRLPQAERAFEHAIAADPGLAGAHWELARLLEATGRSAEAHYQRGLYYSVKGLRARSRREYLAMAAASPSRPDGLLMAARSEFEMQHPARAAALARRAYLQHPASRDAREQAIALAIVGLDRKGAAQWCQEWRRQEPGAAQPLWMLGRLAVDELHYDDGIRDGEQALAKEPGNPVYLQFLGKTLLAASGAGQLPRALSVLSRAAVLAPADAATRYELGLALMRSGRLAEAQRQMLRSLDLDPNQAEPYNVVVQLARRLRQPGPVHLFGPLVRDVEERLREELPLWRKTWDQPDDASGYFALSQFLIHTADPRQAASQLEQALVLRPHWHEAEAELARARRLLAVL